MEKKIKYFLLFIFSGIMVSGQLPDPALVGYWHNWSDADAPYIQLDQVDQRYNVIDIAFAVPHAGTDYQMEFIPDQVTSAAFLSQVQTLQSQGKKIIISIGGAASPVALDNAAERDTFVSTMNNIISAYGFDGIDIDLEGASVSVTGGTISNPVDTKIINLVDAIRQIMSNYFQANNRRLILTMAPETALIQGGMSAFGGIWGAYLPVVDALRDSLELLHVQLYNSGSLFGIDGNVYSQGAADFIVAMTEAVIRGFNTAGGMFAGLLANKVAIGLPACSNAAGGGFTDTTSVRMAIDYLRGEGPQPGSYVLLQAGGYPALRGMMTWSINWDASSMCSPAYQYAENYERIFNQQDVSVPGPAAGSNSFFVYPDPATDYLIVSLPQGKAETAEIYNSIGKMVLSQPVSTGNTVLTISSLPLGIYLIKSGSAVNKFTRQ